MAASDQHHGPLAGVRIVEYAGIGPAPYGVMLLADLGASVIRIDRADAEWPEVPVVSRGRAALSLDLKSPSGKADAVAAMAIADVVVEGFRPGVMERLGLGPEEAFARNPRLVYARMTGWGQTGPMARKAGHDINYIGLCGALQAIAQEDRLPVAPLNLLGDYGGGGVFMALGVIAALFERVRSGQGQVIDAAIVDGTASLLAPVIGMIAAGLMPETPGAGMLSGSKPFYRCYRCADGRDVAVGPLEPQFRRLLADRIGVDPQALDGDDDRIEAVFASRTRDDWADMFADIDACVTPVLTVAEAADHPHLKARSTYVVHEGMMQPAVAPRLSRTPGAIAAIADGRERLRDWARATTESRLDR